jgi:hypothetical protein
MNLNKNSFSARLYRWFYNREEMPKNLCPYFWMLVTAYLFALPVVIFTLPFELVYTKFGKDNEALGTRIGASIIMWFFIFMAFVVISPVLLLFGASFNGSLHNIFHGAILSYIIGTGFGLYYLVKFIYNKIKERNEPKYDEDGNIVIRGRAKKPNILVEFIKAKYNKYCPQITWVNEVKTDNGH